ncbi:DUF3152 domain-containing protein [Propionibacteriaceae bacterium Y1685]
MRESKGRRSDGTESATRRSGGASRARRALPREPGPSLTRRGWTSLVTAICLVVAAGVVGLGWTGATTARPGRAVPQAASGLPVQQSAPAESTPAPDPSASAQPSSTSPEPKKSPKAEQSSTAPAAVKIPKHGSGKYTRATTTKIPKPKKRGQIIRYAVKVEKEVPVDANEAAEFMAATFADKRSWGGDGSLTFVFVPKGEVDVTAYISTPDTTDKHCLPSDTGGKVSCRNGAKVALNANRWTQGVPHFDGDLVSYKQYLVNHEFGHFIGHGHATCPGKGKLAPVMVQQTHGLFGCKKNPWPSPKR